MRKTLLAVTHASFLLLASTAACSSSDDEAGANAAAAGAGGGTSSTGGNQNTGGTAGSKSGAGNGGTAGSKSGAGNGGTAGSSGSTAGAGGKIGGGSSGTGGSSGGGGSSGKGGSGGASGSSGKGGSGGSSGAGGSSGIGGSGGSSGIGGFGGSSGASGAAGTGGATGSPLKHVFYIMMENHGTDQIIGNVTDAPFINDLASKYGVATNYYGVTHPSLPNYLAAISGDFQGIWDDCKAGKDVTCAPEEFIADPATPGSQQLLTPAQVTSATNMPHMFDGPTLVDQLEGKQLTWKAYMQGIPGVGATDEYAPVDTVNGMPVARKLYAQKHNPFMYFSGIRNSADRMKLIVPFDSFAADIASTNVPSFVWISPDQCHDMHGVSPDNATAVNLPSCGYPASGLDHGAIKLGDDFLSATVTAIMASPAWKENSVIVIAWDEDDYSGHDGCCGTPTGQMMSVLGGSRAPALIITSQNAKPQKVADPYNHYSLLGTIQHAWNLDCLGNTCGMQGDKLMTKLFNP